MNGVPWTKSEITKLVDAFETDESVAQIAVRFDRSEEAVRSQVKRLKLGRRGQLWV